MYRPLPVISIMYASQPHIRCSNSLVFFSPGSINITRMLRTFWYIVRVYVDHTGLALWGEDCVNLH